MSASKNYTAESLRRKVPMAKQAAGPMDYLRRVYAPDNPVRRASESVGEVIGRLVSPKAPSAEELKQPLPMVTAVDPGPKPREQAVRLLKYGIDPRQVFTRDVDQQRLNQLNYEVARNIELNNTGGQAALDEATLSGVDPAMPQDRMAFKDPRESAGKYIPRSWTEPLYNFFRRNDPPIGDAAGLDAATDPGIREKADYLMLNDPYYSTPAGRAVAKAAIRGRTDNDLRWKADAKTNISAAVIAALGLGLGAGGLSAAKKMRTAHQMTALPEDTEKSEAKSKRRRASKAPAELEKASSGEVVPPPTPQPSLVDKAKNTVFGILPARHDYEAVPWMLPALALGVPAAFAGAYALTDKASDKYRDALIQRRKQKALEEYRRLLYETTTKTGGFNGMVDFMADVFEKQSADEVSQKSGHLPVVGNTGSGFAGPVTNVYLTYALASALAGYGLMRSANKNRDPGRAKLKALETAIKLRKLSKPTVVLQELPTAGESSAINAEPMSDSAVSPTPYTASFPNEEEGKALEAARASDLEPSLMERGVNQARELADRGVSAVSSGMGHARQAGEEAVASGKSRGRSALNTSRRKLRQMMGKESGLVGYLGMEKHAGEVGEFFGGDYNGLSNIRTNLQGLLTGRDPNKMQQAADTGEAWAGAYGRNKMKLKERAIEQSMPERLTTFANSPEGQKQLAGVAKNVMASPDVKKQIMEGIFDGNTDWGNMLQRIAQGVMGSDKSPFLLKLLAGLFYGPKAQGWGNYFFGNPNAAKDPGTQPPPASTTPPVTPPVTPPAGQPPATPPVTPPVTPPAGQPPATPPVTPPVTPPAGQQAGTPPVTPPVGVQEASPTKDKFAVIHGKNPEEFTLVRMSGRKEEVTPPAVPTKENADNLLERLLGQRSTASTPPVTPPAGQQAGTPPVTPPVGNPPAAPVTPKPNVPGSPQ